jgi:hypothetical protein
MPPSSRLRAIERQAGKLVELLGGDVDGARSLHTVVAGAPVPSLVFELEQALRKHNPRGGGASATDLYASLVSSLIGLVEAAQHCGSHRVKGQRGGKRRMGPSPQGELLEAIFATYADAHELFPDVVAKPGYSQHGPLERFARACLSVAEPRLGERITSRAIEGQIRRWKRKVPTEQSGQAA